MTITQLLTLSVFIGFVVSDPQILPLDNFFSQTSTIVNGVEVGCKLYVASKDDRTLLRNISARTGNAWTSLDTLADYNANGSMKYLTITGDLEIKTTNINSRTELLTGYLYITTYLQAQDPTFAVYVITGQHTIFREGLKSTTVVLNTHLNSDDTGADVPEKTSYVTNIQHSSNTNLYLHWGIPAANWNDVSNNTFFKNPLMIDNTKVFFDHVEPLQVDLDFWYFTADGPVRMDVENKYVENHKYTTTSVNTTGITLNSFLYENHQINFLLDRTRKRTTGTLISTYLDTDVTFQLVGDESVTKTYGFKSNANQDLSVYYFQADRLLVNSTFLPGIFYCQYFGFSTDLLPNAPSTVSTTMGVTTSRPLITTPTVATTTKSTHSHFGLDLSVLLLLSSLFFH